MTFSKEHLEKKFNKGLKLKIEVQNIDTKMFTNSEKIREMSTENRKLGQEKGKLTKEMWGMF